MIFEHVPISIITINKEKKINYINQNAKKFIGQDAVGQNIFDLLSFQDQNTDHIFQANELINFRTKGTAKTIHKNNIPVEILINLDSNSIDKFALIVLIDISDRMLAENKFKSAFEAAPNGMLMVNSKGIIEIVNKQIEDMFGYTRNELVGHPIELLVPDDIKEKHPIFFNSFVINPETRAMGSGRDLYGQKKDGKKIPVEIGLKPVKTDDGLFVICSVVDITKRKKSEEQLKEKHEEVEQFAYRTSHDLRSPLVTIGQLIDLISLDIKEQNTEESLENIEKVKYLVNKLHLLVEDILTLTKLDHESEVSSEFSFEEFHEYITKKMHLEIKSKNIMINKIFMHNKQLNTQKTRLFQILDNLISNSYKYRDTKKESPFINIQTFNDKEYFFIHILDNGIGIPLEKQSEVFTMFKRFHKTSAVGSGLGLYMVLKNIKKLNGTISFESSEFGTNFYIKVPIS